MKVTVDIDPGTVLVEELKSQYRSLKGSIAVLESRDNLMQYQVEDLCNDRKYLKAHRLVLKYNLCRDEFEEFLKECGE